MPAAHPPHASPNVAQAGRRTERSAKALAVAACGATLANR